MTRWARVPNSKHLNIVETDIDNSNESEPESKEKKKDEVQPRQRMLNDIFYPLRTTEPSCFNIPTLENVSLKLKPQSIHMLPMFTGIENAYLFL